MSVRTQDDENLDEPNGEVRTQLVAGTSDWEGAMDAKLILDYLFIHLFDGEPQSPRMRPHYKQGLNC